MPGQKFIPKMLIILNEADSFEASPVPVVHPKASFLVCPHLIRGRCGNWKQAISEGQSCRKRSPLMQFCLGRVRSRRRVQLGLSQGLSWEEEGEHIPEGVGKRGKVTEECNGPTRKVSPGRSAVGTQLCQCPRGCSCVSGGASPAWLSLVVVFQLSLLGRY